MLVGGVYVADVRARLAEAWRPARGSKYEQRRLDAIRRIIVHHVGGVNRDYTADEIARYHVRTRGWPGIAYHFLAHQDGRLEYVGDLVSVRYHVGLINRESIGICVAGDFNKERPAQRQLMRVNMLVGGLWRELGRYVPVYGHRDVWQLTGYGFTECPGDTWLEWRARVVPEFRGERLL